MYIAILIIFNQDFLKDHKGKIYIPYFLSFNPNSLLFSKFTSFRKTKSAQLTLHRLCKSAIKILDSAQ